LPKFNIRDAALEYVEKGSGDPVLLVHGSASDYRTWGAQLSAFSRRYRTVAYSRRYHWPNATIGENDDYSMEEHVGDLERVLRSLGKRPLHLVGHSYGAFVCLLLAIKQPRLLRSLVLAEPPAITLFVSSSPKPSEMLKLLFKRPRTALAILQFGMRGLNPAKAEAERGNMDQAMRVFGGTVLGRDFLERLSESRLEQVRANAIQAEFIGSGFPDLDADRVRNMKVPTLLVGAEQSPAVFHRVLDRLQELLPNSRRVEIHGASHIMHEDNPIEYNEAVLSFWEAHTPDPPPTS